MTVRIGDAGCSGRQLVRRVHTMGEFRHDGGRIAMCLPLSRHRLIWRFAAQKDLKQKA